MSFSKAAPKTAPSESNPSTTPTDLSEKPLPEISEEALPDPTITVVTAAQPHAQPLRRPGTSGTELALTSNRRAASQTFQAARRAERSYKARKRSAAARTAYASAKTHFGAAAHHFKVGVKLTLEVVGSVPYMVEDKRERRREAAAGQRKEAQRVAAVEEKAAVVESRDGENDGVAGTRESEDAATQQQARVEEGDEARK